MHMLKDKPASTLALCAVIAAWGAAGAAFWWETTEGLMQIITVALTVGCQVWGALALHNAVQSGSKAKLAVGVIIGAGCLLWSGWSGKQALDHHSATRIAPYEAALAAHDGAQREVDRITADLAALPTMALDVPAARLRALTAERAAVEGRLATAKADLAAKPKPAEVKPLPQWLTLAMVVLIEAMEFFGAWILGHRGVDRRQAQAAQIGALMHEVIRFVTWPPVRSNPGRDLVAKRWAKQQ